MFFTRRLTNLKNLSKNGAPELYFARHHCRIWSSVKLSRKPVHKMSTSISKFSMFRECFVIRSLLVKVLYNIFLTTTNATRGQIWPKFNGTVNQKREKNVKIKSNTETPQPMGSTPNNTNNNRTTSPERTVAQVIGEAGGGGGGLLVPLHMTCFRFGLLMSSKAYFGVKIGLIHVFVFFFNIYLLNDTSSTSLPCYSFCLRCLLLF